MLLSTEWAPRQNYADQQLQSAPAPEKRLSVQPGVASVYCTIVQQSLNGSEFYIRAFPELHGFTFGQARRCFNGVIVVGYMRKGDKPELRLNPEDADVLKEGDRIVALSDTGRAPSEALHNCCMSVAADGLSCWQCKNSRGAENGS